MYTYIAIWVALVLWVGGSWVTNVIQLTRCDFASPYKCEVVHAVGLIPFASVITVWLDTGQ